MLEFIRDITVHVHQAEFFHDQLFDFLKLTGFITIFGIQNENTPDPLPFLVLVHIFPYWHHIPGICHKLDFPVIPFRGVVAEVFLSEPFSHNSLLDIRYIPDHSPKLRTIPEIVINQVFAERGGFPVRTSAKDDIVICVFLFDFISSVVFHGSS